MEKKDIELEQFLKDLKESRQFLFKITKKIHKKRANYRSDDDKKKVLTETSK